MKRLIAIAIVATLATSTFFVSSVSAQTPNFLEPSGQYGEWTEVSTEDLRDAFPAAGGLTSLQMHDNRLWAFGTIDYSDPAIFYSDGEDWFQDSLPGLAVTATYAVSSVVVEETLYVMINHSGSTESQLWYHTAADGWAEDETFDTSVDMTSALHIVSDGEQICVSGRQVDGNLALGCGGPDAWTDYDLGELGSDSYFGDSGSVTIVNGNVVIAVSFSTEGDWVSALMIYEDDTWSILDDSTLLSEEYGDDYWSGITSVEESDYIFTMRHSESSNVASVFVVDVELETFVLLGDENFGTSGDIYKTFFVKSFMGFPIIGINRGDIGEMWISDYTGEWSAVNDEDDFSDGDTAPSRIDDMIFVEQQAIFAVTNYDGEGLYGPRIWMFTGFSEPEPTTTTTMPVTDGDGDNVTDADENGAPNGGDANADGTPDSEQSEVTSFVNPVTGKYATLAVTSDTECSIDNASIAPESTDYGDNEYSYPNGLMSFGIDCNGLGSTATVQLTFFDAGEAKDFIGRKFIDNSYLTLNGASLEDVTVGGEAGIRLTYSLVDGGQLDADGEANGTIVDPAGLGTIAASGTLPSTGSNPIFLISTGLILMIGGALFVRRSRRTSLL